MSGLPRDGGIGIPKTAYGKPLTKRELKAIELLNLGMTQTDVAKEMGMSSMTIAKIINRDDVVRMRWDAAKRIMAGATIKATNLLIKQLDNENPWIAQNAARTVLQFAEQIDKHQETQLVVNFVSMPTPAMPSPEPIEAEGGVD